MAWKTDQQIPTQLLGQTAWQSTYNIGFLEDMSWNTQIGTTTSFVKQHVLNAAIVSGALEFQYPDVDAASGLEVFETSYDNIEDLGVTFYDRPIKFALHSTGEKRKVETVTWTDDSTNAIHGFTVGETFVHVNELLKLKLVVNGIQSTIVEKWMLDDMRFWKWYRFMASNLQDNTTTGRQVARVLFKSEQIQKFIVLEKFLESANPDTARTRTVTKLRRRFLMYELSAAPPIAALAGNWNSIDADTPTSTVQYGRVTYPITS